jgi:hypothetical protein
MEVRRSSTWGPTLLPAITVGRTEELIDKISCELQRKQRISRQMNRVHPRVGKCISQLRQRLE